MVGRTAPCGLRPDIAVHEVDVRLEAGDALLLYTDGVTEAARGARPFGEPGLVGVLSGMGGQSPQAVVDAVERAVVAAQPGDPHNDIALLAICRPRAWTAASG